jgi:hypothetical protein
MGDTSKSLGAEDVLPLIAHLTPQERRRLVRLITEQPGADDRDAYRVLPPGRHEFSADDDSLAWDAEGWEDIG